MKKIIKLMIFFGILFGLTSTYAKTTIVYEFQGVNEEILQNIKARLASQENHYSNDLTRKQVYRILNNATKQIELAVQPYGYFKPVTRFILSRHDSTWKVIYQINLGKPLIIGKIKLTLQGPGKNDPILRKMILDTPLKIGSVFNSLTYEKEKEKYLEVANEQGYIKLAIEYNKVIINLETNQAEVFLSFETGPQYYFGKVNFVTNFYNQLFLRRFVKIKKNETFSSQKLIKFQQAMTNSPYFSKVIIIPDYTNIKDDKIPLQVNPVPPKSQKYNLGLGYGTFTHTRISTGVSLRNLTKTGHYLDAQIRASSIISGLAVKYYMPGKNPLFDQWILGTNIEIFTPKDISSRSTTIFGGYETKLKEIKSSINLNYLIERYRIYPSPRETSEILFPRLNLYYIKADELINPKFGNSIEVTLQGSTRYAMSSTNFIQCEIKEKTIFSLFGTSRFILRGDLGYTSVSNIQDLPATLRFYAGELNGLRGFPDSSIGPGRYLMIGSIEYQHYIFKDWHGAVFYDIGKASNHINDSFNQSNGIGIIYKSLIGPIKLYVAHALQTQSKPYSIEFNIGPEF